MTASPDRIAGELPRLHLVADDAVLRSPIFEEHAARLIGAGGPRMALHLRSRAMGGARLLEVAERCQAAAVGCGGWLFINDRLDVAVASGASGVQLGVASFPVALARRVVGRLWVGASVHDRAEAACAAREGADFLLAGTLFRSDSHPGRKGSGSAWIGSLGALGLPVIGIGGVTPERVPEVLAAGAHGVAVIGGIWYAPSPPEALESYLAQIGA